MKEALIILKHFVSVFLVNLNHFITIDWHCTNCKHRLYPNLSTCLTIVPVKWPTVNCQLVAMSQTHTHMYTAHLHAHLSDWWHKQQQQWQTTLAPTSLSFETFFVFAFLSFFDCCCFTAKQLVLLSLVISLFLLLLRLPTGSLLPTSVADFAFFPVKKKLLLKANCGKHFGIAGSNLIYFFHN